MFRDSINNETSWARVRPDFIDVTGFNPIPDIFKKMLSFCRDFFNNS